MLVLVRRGLLAGDAVATIDRVSLDITVVLGVTTMPVHQVLRLGRGAIIELDASEDDEVQILANNLPVAKGTVIVSGNRIAVEVKEMLPLLPIGRPCPSTINLLHGPPSFGAAPLAGSKAHLRSWRNW